MPAPKLETIEQLRLAIQMILSGDPEGALAVLGVECSIFVAINKGTHKRDELMPFGDCSMPSVIEANKGTSRQGSHVSLNSAWPEACRGIEFKSCKNNDIVYIYIYTC